MLTACLSKGRLLWEGFRAKAQRSKGAKKTFVSRRTLSVRKGHDLFAGRAVCQGRRVLLTIHD